jgi:glycosyltransferase involved in cell wall biosynthesis
MAADAALRVLLATNSRDRGSTSRTLEAWARLLPGHGVSPIVTLGGEGPLLDALTVAGIPAYQHPIRYFFDARRPVPFLTAIAKLALRIRRSGVELVHVNEHEHYPVVARAAYLARVPTAVHVRFRPTPEMCRWLFKPPYTPRRIFFTSQTQMDDAGDAVAEAVPRDRFRLVYNGLDFDRFGRDAQARSRLRAAWHVTDDTLVLGVASSISARKRLDHFIRLVVNLAKAGIAVRGFIAGQPYFDGDREELKSLHALVESLGATELVTFLGYVEPAEPLYYAWDLCVSTSEYETFGMTVLEAMACRCPVLTYPGGSVREVVASAGTVVADADEAALLAAALQFVDPGRRRELGALARLRAEEFDVKRSVATLTGEYREIAG